MAAWRALFSDLKARGLPGIEMLTSDAHDGMRSAALQSPFAAPKQSGQPAPT